MLRNILAIARITALDLWNRRVGLAYVGIAAIFFGLAGTVQVHTQSNDGVNQFSSFSTLGMGSFGLRLGTLLALYVAAKSVDLEVQQRTLSAVMIRPVGRHAYLLGRFAGGLAVYAAFLLAAAAFSVGMSLKNGTPLDAGMGWSIASAAVNAVTWMAIVLPLAAVTTFPASMTFIVGAEVFGWAVGIAPTQASPLLPYLKDAAYYLSPVEVPQEASWQALLPVAASLAYGAVCFASGSLLFARQDLRLRA